MGRVDGGISTAIVLLATILMAQALPTSVLVESKHATGTSGKVQGETSKPDATVEKILSQSNDNADGLKPKLTPQKRGVNPNIYGRDLSGDISINNLPHGVWDDVDANILYPELQEYDDYNSFQPSAYRPKPYDNLQNVLNSNIYDEPEAIPVRYPYARFMDDRKKRSPSNHIQRLKRNSANKKPVDMASLLAMLEAKERARLNAEPDYGHLYDYPALPYYHNVDDDSDDQGEWLNNYIEPRVQQAYENIYRQFDPSPYYSDNRPGHRFVVSKKKRSLNSRDMRGAIANHLLPNSQQPYASAFDSRYASTRYI